MLTKLFKRRYSDEDVDAVPLIFDHLYNVTTLMLFRGSRLIYVYNMAVMAFWHSSHSSVLLLLNLLFLLALFSNIPRLTIDGLRNDLNKINWHALIEDKSINGAWCAFPGQISCMHS